MPICDPVSHNFTRRSRSLLYLQCPAQCQVWVGIRKNHRNVCRIILKIKVQRTQECKITHMANPTTSTLFNKYWSSSNAPLTYKSSPKLKNEIMEAKVLCFPSTEVKRKLYINDTTVAKRSKKITNEKHHFYFLNHKTYKWFSQILTKEQYQQKASQSSTLKLYVRE